MKKAIIIGVFLSLVGGSVAIGQVLTTSDPSIAHPQTTGFNTTNNLFYKIDYRELFDDKGTLRTLVFSVDVRDAEGKGIVSQVTADPTDLAAYKAKIVSAQALAVKYGAIGFVDAETKMKAEKKTSQTIKEIDIQPAALGSEIQKIKGTD
jgi:hypothetical protein